MLIERALVNSFYRQMMLLFDVQLLDLG